MPAPSAYHERLVGEMVSTLQLTTRGFRGAVQAATGLRKEVPRLRPDAFRVLADRRLVEAFEVGSAFCLTGFAITKYQALVAALHGVSWHLKLFEGRGGRLRELNLAKSMSAEVPRLTGAFCAGCRHPLSVCGAGLCSDTACFCDCRREVAT